MNIDDRAYLPVPGSQEYNQLRDGGVNWIDQRQSDLAHAIAQEVKKVQDENLKHLNEAIEKWNEREEAEANKYVFVPASQLRNGMTICESSFKNRRTIKFRVSKRHSPRSRFDRHVVVTVDKTKTWRYDPQDLVMVLA